MNEKNTKNHQTPIATRNSRALSKVGEKMKRRRGTCGEGRRKANRKCRCGKEKYKIKNKHKIINK